MDGTPGGPVERRRRLATRLGWASAVVVVLVTAAGADRPPPPGFVLVVGFAAFSGVAVRLTLPALLDLSDARGWRPAIARAALGGLLIGLGLAALATRLSAGEPSIEVGPGERLVGLAAVGVVGALAATAITVAGLLLDRRSPRP